DLDVDVERLAESLAFESLFELLSDVEVLSELEVEIERLAESLAFESLFELLSDVDVLSEFEVEIERLVDVLSESLTDVESDLDVEID
ncbi:hypothetical protein EFN31_09180, partial [Pediococcus pentosaceus]|nr:hypothetical protein [Pediococcus pentosaceus]